MRKSLIWSLIASALILGITALGTASSPALAQGCNNYRYSTHPGMFTVLKGNPSGGYVYAVNGEIDLEFAPGETFTTVSGSSFDIGVVSDGVMARWVDFYNASNEWLADSGYANEYRSQNYSGTFGTGLSAHHAIFRYRFGTNNTNYLSDITFCVDEILGPTPTPTATPATPPPPIAGQGTCPLLGDDNANFGPNNVWRDTPDFGPPSGETRGLLMPQAGGFTQVLLKLKPTAKYRFRVRFDNPLSYYGYSFAVTIGSAPPIPIPIGPGTGQSYTSEYYNWPPDDDDPNGWSLIINLQDPLDLVIRYICIDEEVAPVAMADLEHEKACSDCLYQPTGDIIEDITGVLAWLWCGIARFFSCVIGSILYQIWGIILQIAALIGSIFSWFAQSFLAILSWIANVTIKIVGWLGGTAANLIVLLVDVLRSLAESAIGGIAALFAAFGALAYIIISAIISIFEFAGIAIGHIGAALGSIGLLFSSLVASANASAATIPAWAPTCADQNSFLFAPCLAFYILDNTIFSGPVFYIIPIAMAIIGWAVVSWSLRQLQQFFSEL